MENPTNLLARCALSGYELQTLAETHPENYQTAIAEAIYAKMEKYMPCELAGRPMTPERMTVISELAAGLIVAKRSLLRCECGAIFIDEKLLDQHVADCEAVQRSTFGPDWAEEAQVRY